jgi:hypothetical protein
VVGAAELVVVLSGASESAITVHAITPLSTTATPMTAAMTIVPRGNFDDGGAQRLRVRRLQVADQRPQFPQRGGVGDRGDPLPVLLHRQLSVGERGVEHLAGCDAVAVLRACPVIAVSPRRRS